MLYGEQSRVMDINSKNRSAASSIGDSGDDCDEIVYVQTVHPAELIIQCRFAL